MIATKPKILDLLKMFSEGPANAAIIAPTIMTDEIALVTDIKGVWRWRNAPYNVIADKN